MLTRLRFRKDFRLMVRCLSDKVDKPADEGISPKIESKEAASVKKISDNATEKIQELLKSMLAKPKISAEDAQKFTTAPDRRKKDVLVTKTEKIEESLTKAATNVAEALGGDVKQTEAELLSRVLGKIDKTSTSLSDLIVGMKVDRKRDPDAPKSRDTRGQQVQRQMDRPQASRYQREDSDTRSQSVSQETRFTRRKENESRRQNVSTAKPMTVDVFNSEPLGVFKAGESNYGTELAMWERLKQRELTLATAQPPANYFEKMILWTEQGKVWKFPIDNEQGLDEEQKVHFSEHIFLDAHLEDWCPKKGPIRHFMELVCIGLSKNAFYTVQEKKDHIMWYKDYFESKQDLLNEVGAWDTKPAGEVST